jgi:CelD/BcsL family acetyltransferase involved in cellulose biosynthesis
VTLPVDAEKDPGSRGSRAASQPAVAGQGTELRRIGLDDEAWAQLVASDRCALAFHHPAWARMLGECYGFRAFALALANDEGRLIAGVPLLETGGRLRGRKWISLPFTDICPPLVVGDGDLQARLEAEIDAARLEAGIDSVELRATPAGDRALIRPSGLRHTIQLEPDPDSVFLRLKRDVRRAIRFAAKGGVVVTRSEREEDLTQTFYGLHTETRRRLGVPVQPRRYFSLLWRRVVKQGLGFVLVARVKDRPVAASVYLPWNRTLIAKYSASDAAAWSLRPNNAVLWHAISCACEEGYSTLDLGRTDAGDEGLREFKRRWDAEEVPLVYGMLGRARASGSGAERLARLARPFIQRSPLFVCRGLGKAFYRYAA